MKHKKRIKLKLGKDWYYFDSQRFRPVGNKQYFRPGNLLYRDSEFYLVVGSRKKMKKISWNHAGKKIYRTRIGTSNRPNYPISKSKILFAFQINDEEEVQTCLKRDTLPFTSELYPELPPNVLPDSETSESPSQPSADAEKRAKLLFHKLVNSNPRFRKHHNSLYIRSINRRTYRISLNTAGVYDVNEVPLCVQTYHRNKLPLYDIVISKALTIAYAPKRISTL